MTAEGTVGAPICLSSSSLNIGLRDFYLVAIDSLYNFAFFGVFLFYLPVS
jgi:hypothetical protein